MKAYVDTHLKSLAVKRVVDAFNRYSPSYIQIVNNVQSADLVLVHINGRVESNTRYINHINKPYAVIQYAFESTQKPDTKDWMHIWNNAELVWSYLYLEGEFDFYHAPLGADSDVFYPIDGVPKAYAILTSGPGYLAESVREVYHATQHLGLPMAHLGSYLGKPPIDYFTNITDEELVMLYNRCRSVSGLRRVEGFELPAAEGLLCGVRPILFDRTHYRNWYDGLAIFIPETERDQIVIDVENVLRQGVEPVTNKEIAESKERFNWNDLIKEFWSYV